MIACILLTAQSLFLLRRLQLQEEGRLSCLLRAHPESSHSMLRERDQAMLYSAGDSGMATAAAALHLARIRRWKLWPQLKAAPQP